MKYLVAIGMTILTVFVWFQVITNLDADDRQYKEYVTQAENYRERGLYVKAVNAYFGAHAVAEEEQKYDLELKIIDCVKQLGDMGMYEDYCLQAIQAFPDQQECYRMLLDYYQETKAYSMLVPMLELSMERFPEESAYQEAYLEIEKDYVEIKQGYEEMSDWMDGYLVAKTVSKMSEDVINRRVKLQGLESVKEEDESEEMESDNPEMLLETEYRVFNSDGIEETEGIYYKEMSLTDNYTYKFIVKDEKNRWKTVNTKDYEMENNLDISFEKIGPLHEGYAWAIVDKNYYLINQTMNLSIFSFGWIGTFQDGYTAVMQDDKWALFSSEEMEACTDYAYSDIKVDEFQRCYINGRFFAKTSDGYQMFDAEGNIMSGEEIYEDARPFLGQQPTAVKQNGKWGFATSDGQMYIDPEYEDAKPFSNGYAAVRQNGKWGFINKDNVMVIEPKYEDVRSFSGSGIAPVKNENGYWDFVQMHTVRY